MDVSTAAFLGSLVGGVLGVYFLHLLWEYALFQRVFDDPVKGKVASVIAAYLTASIVSGFARANGGPFVPSGFLIYLPGAVIVSFFAIRRGMKLRDQAERAEAVTDAFN